MEEVAALKEEEMGEHRYPCGPEGPWPLEDWSFPHWPHRWPLRFSSHIHFLSGYCVPGSGSPNTAIVLPSRCPPSGKESRRPHTGFAPARVSERANVRPTRLQAAVWSPHSGAAHLLCVSSQAALWAAAAQEAEVPGKGAALLPPPAMGSHFLPSHRLQRQEEPTRSQ